MMRMVMVVLLILGLGVAAQAGQGSPRTPPTAKASASAVVNLNTASVAQLETLPGIGKSTAERILEYREKSGGFRRSRRTPTFLRLGAFLGALDREG